MSVSGEFTVEITGELRAEDVRAVIEDLEPETNIEAVRIEIATDDPTDLTITSNGGKREGIEDAPAVRLQVDSDPFYIACVLHGDREWYRSEEISDRLPEEWGVSEDALGTNLWSLSDRGLLEKRPYEADRRQKEYRITERGERALREAFERTDAVSVEDVDDPATLLEAL